MSSKDFLVAHGEKVALGLVVGLSGWAVYGTVSNPLVYPAGVTDERIDGMIQQVVTAQANQPAPQIKRPDNYVEKLRKRIDTTLAMPNVIPWLTTQPDSGRPIANQQPVYLYELLPPTRITGTEKVGTIELTIALPEVRHQGSDSRISDASFRTWASQGGKVINLVQRVGVRLEYSVGGTTGPFNPVTGDGIVDGFVPIVELERSTLTCVFKAATAWERYHIRGSLVVKATGFPLEQEGKTTPAQSVLVSIGRWPAPYKEIDWSGLQSKVEQRDADTVALFGKPLTATYGVELKPGERLYAGSPTLCPPIDVTSVTRFAFEKVIAIGEDPGASVLVTTLVSPPPGVNAPPKWLVPPIPYKLKLKDIVGDKRPALDPFGAGNRPFDLTTPFMLTEIKPEIERTLYYELSTKSRATGGGKRDLDIKAKVKTVEGVVFTNSATKQTLVYSRMIRIEKPAPKMPAFQQFIPGNFTKVEGPFIYPDFNGTAYDEREEFLKSPADYKQRAMVPTEPTWYEPNDPKGPLAAQFQRAGVIYQTDTRYVAFPDGRVFFWDTLNNRVVSFFIPDSDAELSFKNKKPVAPPTLPPPTTNRPPAPR